MKTTIQCEEFYNLMQNYRHADKGLVMPKEASDAYKAVIDYIDVKLSEKKVGCNECGKLESDGFALYCVKCIEKIEKAVSKDCSQVLQTTNETNSTSAIDSHCTSHDFGIEPSSGIKMCIKCGLTYMLYKKQDAQPDSDIEIIGYQFKWLNPMNSENVGALIDWKPVKPVDLQTEQQAIDELLQYRHEGQPVYRVRAIYALAHYAQPLGNIDRNWSEDFGHENGNYSCECNHCNKYFIGHKRRIICKECAYKLLHPVQPKGTE